MNEEIEAIVPSEMTEADIESCLSIIDEGDAVDIEYARQQIPQSVLVAVCRDTSKIVAVGVVKGKRPQYAADKALKSGFDFDNSIHEIGYIAVRETHKGRHLSRQILQSLLAHFAERPLFATTSNDRMKATLRFAGFEQKGKEWRGPRGNLLSLWIKSVF